MSCGRPAGGIAHERPNDEAPRRRERDAVEIRGDYQARALESKWAAQRFWHSAKIRLMDRVAPPAAERPGRRRRLRLRRDCRSSGADGSRGRGLRFEPRGGGPRADGLSPAQPPIRARPVRTHGRRRALRPHRVPRSPGAPLPRAGAGHPRAVRPCGFARRHAVRDDAERPQRLAGHRMAPGPVGPGAHPGRSPAPDAVLAVAAAGRAASGRAGRWRRLAPSTAWRRSSRHSENRSPGASNGSSSGPAAGCR